MVNLSLSELVAGFFVDLQLRNQTEATIKTCRWHIDRFLKFLAVKGVTIPEQITRELLREYQVDLVLTPNIRGRRNTPATVNRYMGSVAGFIRYLKRENHLPPGPEQGITYARTGRQLPQTVLSREEMVRLIEAPDIRTVLGYRDRTIMELLYTTAIRRNECRLLTVCDIDFTERLLRVYGKGRKERMVPIGRIALKFLEGYLVNVRPVLVMDPVEEHLFLSSKGRRMSRNVMGEFIAKYARRAGIDKRVTPHTFRHTCATLMLRNHADVRHIQVLLGHESLESTQIYTHVAATDLKEVLEKYHPRERDHERAKG